MQTQRVSLSRLNEMITETVEARPTELPPAHTVFYNINNYSQYWNLAAPEREYEKSYFIPAKDFTDDEGAILRLIRDKKCRIEIALLPGGFCVAAYNPDNPPNQTWAGDAKPPRWYWQEWYGDENTPLAPALCCAYYFALTGILLEIEEEA